jgi:hypothetical protein
MRHPLLASLLVVLLAIPVLSQTTPTDGDLTSAHASMPQRHIKQDMGDKQAIDLLTQAEAGSSALNGQMRAWVLWQIGMAYQSVDKTKAFNVLQTALSVARATKDGGTAGKDPMNNLLQHISGHPSFPPGLVLERDIARSIVLLKPKQADRTLEQVDPAVRTPILISLLASQEKEKQFDRAMETLARISAQDEVPYEYATRLMENLKPQQSADLTQLFLTALTSYRNHAPHSQLQDAFPIMVSHCWKRLPKQVVTEAVDEILTQAKDVQDNGNYSMLSQKGVSSMRSLYEYRLAQLMPMLREFDPSTARQYEEKYPSLASDAGTSNSSDDTAHSETQSSGNDFQFHPTPDNPSAFLTAMVEQTAAQNATAKSDNGHMEEAISDAANLQDSNLRAQVYEYIARHAVAKQDSSASDAIERMLQAAEKLQPRQAFPYYGAAGDIYLKINLIDDAKESIELGLKAAKKLYEKDANEDDPNTALKAFWPSTNAYCTMVRQAARISPTWAIILLKEIEDPEIKVAAETALASGWLKSPTGPNTIITATKTSSSVFFGGSN